MRIEKLKTQSRIYNLPKGWWKVKLGEVAILNPSVYLEKGEKYPFISMERVEIGKKYISPSEIKEYKGGGTKFRDGDILFARITPSLEHGKCGVVKLKGEKKVGFGSTEFFVFRGKENITYTDYLYYLSKTHELRQTAINSMVGVSGRQRARIDAIVNYEFHLPPLNEQQRIADILSAFDEKIELNNKINQILEEMAQAIFKEWLLKNQKSKTKSQKVRDLAEIISGYPFKSKLYTKSQKGALGVVTIKNVQDGDFVTHCDSFIRKEDIPENMNLECFIRNGDILLSLTGNVGRVCFVYGGDYLLNQRVAKLKPINQKDKALVYFLFRQKSMQILLVNMAKGSAQPNLSPVETGEIEINLPSRNVLDKFAEIVNPIYDYLVQNKVENQKLSALRDLLLPKLMSGEVRVQI